MIDCRLVERAHEQAHAPNTSLVGKGTRERHALLRVRHVDGGRRHSECDDARREVLRKPVGVDDVRDAVVVAIARPTHGIERIRCADGLVMRPVSITVVISGEVDTPCDRIHTIRP